MPKTILDRLRWVLVLPLSFLSSLLILIGVVFLGDSFNMSSRHEYIEVFIAFASISVVSSWLLTSYFIAPAHKGKTLWVLYLIGCFIALLLASFIYTESHGDEKFFAIIFFFSSSISGLIICLSLQAKGNLINFIEKEIKTTHL